MNVDNLLELVHAGFTKEEIFKLAELGKTKTEPAKPAEPAKAEPEEPAKAEPAEPAKAEPEEPAEDKIKTAIETALKPFETLYNNMAKLAAMPSLDNVEPKGIDDIVDRFFEKGE